MLPAMPPAFGLSAHNRPLLSDAVCLTSEIITYNNESLEATEAVVQIKCQGVCLGCVVWQSICKIPSIVVTIASTSFHPVSTSASMQNRANGGGCIVAAMSEKIISCPYRLPRIKLSPAYSRNVAQRFWVREQDKGSVGKKQ